MFSRMHVVRNRPSVVRFSFTTKIFINLLENFHHFCWFTISYKNSFKNHKTLLCYESIKLCSWRQYTPQYGKSNIFVCTHGETRLGSLSWYDRREGGKHKVLKSISSNARS